MIPIKPMNNSPQFINISSLIQQQKLLTNQQYIKYRQCLHAPIKLSEKQIDKAKIYFKNLHKNKDQLKRIGIQIVSNQLSITPMKDQSKHFYLNPESINKVSQNFLTQKQLIRKQRKLKEIKQCILLKQKSKKNLNRYSNSQQIKNKDALTNQLNKYMKGNGQLEDLQKSIILSNRLVHSPKQLITHRKNIQKLAKAARKLNSHTIAHEQYHEQSGIIQKSKQQNRKKENISQQEQQGQKQVYLLYRDYIAKKIKQNSKISRQFSARDLNPTSLNSSIINGQQLNKSISKSKSQLDKLNNKNNNNYKKINKMKVVRCHELSHNVHHIGTSKSAIQMQNDHEIYSTRSIQKNKKIEEARNLKKYINKQKVKFIQERQNNLKQLLQKNRNDIIYAEDQRRNYLDAKFSQFKKKRDVSLPAINGRRNKFYDYDPHYQEEIAGERGQQSKLSLFISHESNDKIKFF